MPSRRAALLLSLTAGLATTAALVAPSASVARRASAPPTYLTGDCVHPTSKPASVTLYCGDGNQFFTKLSWHNWGTSVANAHGMLNVNTCNPNCAAGHDVTATAVLTVLKPKVCGKSRRRQYTQWEVEILGTPPKGILPNSNGSFLCG